jgi:predicted metalloprotease with PDZ domain
VPHRVVYWSSPNAKEFDTTRLLSGIRKIAEQASLLFGRFPYRDFAFMMQDGALGSLEHNNSVTIGAPVAQLIDDMDETFSEIAHEYFHTWNLIRIHPIECTDVNYKTPPLSRDFGSVKDSRCFTLICCYAGQACKPLIQQGPLILNI